MLLAARPRTPNTSSATTAADVGVQHIERRDAVDPHHRRGGVADDAARAAGVGRGDDGREKADVHLARNSVCAIAPPISAAAMLSRNDDSTNTIASSAKQPFQSSGSSRGSASGHVALLEMARQEREAEQQARQVRDDHPFVRQMRDQPVEARPGRERAEQQLIRDDHGQPADRAPRSVW